MLNFIFFFLALFFVVKAADYAMQSADKLAQSLNLSKYLVGFLLVAIISVLPETFISLSAAFQGNPSFGLGTLFGSNVADLTLVLVIIIFVSSTPLKVESHLIKNSFLYLAILAVPIVFGLDGYYSRLEGLSLIFLGLLFYLYLFKKNPSSKKKVKGGFSGKDFLGLLFFMGVLLVAANFTVKFGIDLAIDLKINPILVGMLFVGVGTTLPELLFSLKAVKEKNHALAMGDILGTVITDATIIVGLLALVNPFAFSQRIVYLTAMFMLFAAVLLFYFMKSGRAVTKKEALFLLFYYLVFVLLEFAVGNYFFK
jgi:cation:H+ antiporter